MKLTNNKTYNQINKLVSETACPINTLCISYPYKYAAKAACLNWYDIYFAIENKYLVHQSAIEHAMFELEKSADYTQAVLDLAVLCPNEAIFPHSIYPFIVELSNTVEDTEKIKAKDKMMYVLLKWVYEHKDDYEDIFDVSSIICDDFDFPESITHFAWRYSPMKGPDLGSVEKNIERIFDEWKQFLDEQHEKWN